MNKKGFTLIELLVVVLIIGILASVALPQYQKAVGKARVMKVLPVLRAIYDAKQVYFLANGTYEADLDSLDVNINYSSSEVADNGNYTYKSSIGRLVLHKNNAGVSWTDWDVIIDLKDGNRILCYGYNTQGDEICASLNSKKMDNVTTNTGFPYYEVKF